jgi:hypothetical protein
VYISIDFNKLGEKKKEYPWERLGRCPSCKGPRVWGHGYVLRYFDSYEEGVWLKRYRCAECRAVHTVRPETHYRGFWVSIASILDSLLEKALYNRWLSRYSRQRQQYWWRGFVKQASRKRNPQGDPLAVLFTLLSQGIILSTHSSEYCEIRPFRVPTHLIFAVTAATGYG